MGEIFNKTFNNLVIGLFQKKSLSKRLELGKEEVCVLSLEDTRTSQPVVLYLLLENKAGVTDQRWHFLPQNWALLTKETPRTFSETQSLQLHIGLAKLVCILNNNPC